MRIINIEKKTIDNIKKGKRCKKDAVFLALVINDTDMQRHFSSKMPKEDSDYNITKILMVNRWDMMTGFPGGIVDHNESLFQALVREVKEEINFNINQGYIYNLKINESDLLCSHVIDKDTDNEIGIHLYHKVIHSRYLARIINNAVTARDFGTETQGLFTGIINELPNNKGLGNLVNNGIFGLRTQLKELINFYV